MVLYGNHPLELHKRADHQLDCNLKNNYKILYSVYMVLCDGLGCIFVVDVDRSNTVHNKRYLYKI